MRTFLGGEEAWEVGLEVAAAPLEREASWMRKAAEEEEVGEMGFRRLIGRRGRRRDAERRNMVEGGGDGEGRAEGLLYMGGRECDGGGGWWWG